MNTNFKEKIKNIPVYVLVGLILLGIILLYIGLNSYLSIAIIGVILILPFVVWLMIEKKAEKVADEKFNEEILNLKKYGDKIIVNLENAKIYSNSWREEVIPTSRHEEFHYVDKNHNTIEIEILYKGEILIYTFGKDMETAKLKMHFAMKRETVLYIDSKDKNNHYLDLEFLV